jgi:hypothetical protein
MRHVKEDWAAAAEANTQIPSSHLGSSRGTIAALGNHQPRTSQKRYALKLGTVMEVSSNA